MPNYCVVGATTHTFFSFKGYTRKVLLLFLPGRFVIVSYCDIQFNVKNKNLYKSIGTVDRPKFIPVLSLR